MITLDTNLLLRVILRDDAAQTAEAEAFLLWAEATEEPLYIAPFSLLELVWILTKHGFARADVVKVLEGLLTAQRMVVGHRASVTQALAWYRRGKADFADYLIHADGASVGASNVATFDARFAREDAHRKRPNRWVKG